LLLNAQISFILPVHHTAVILNRLITHEIAAFPLDCLFHFYKKFSFSFHLVFSQTFIFQFSIAVEECCNFSSSFS